MKKLKFILLGVLFSCSAGKEDANRPSEWMGNWKAVWETPQEAYPGVEDMEFFMDGNFNFVGDSLTVTNHGYPGCIFAADTLKHTQSWKISGDTLICYNDPATPGMTYKIKRLTEDKIELQLMEDIFVTLTK